MFFVSKRLLYESIFQKKIFHQFFQFVIYLLPQASDHAPLLKLFAVFQSGQNDVGEIWASEAARGSSR